MYGKTLSSGSRGEIWSSWKVVSERSGDDWWKRSGYCKCYLLLNTCIRICFSCVAVWNTSIEMQLECIIWKKKICLKNKTEKSKEFWVCCVGEGTDLHFWGRGRRDFFVCVVIFISSVEIWRTSWMFSNLLIITWNKSSPLQLPV